MEYVLQHRDFGLGNFINLTPAITWIYQQRRQRVPVYFETEYVRQCFLDWPCIEILDTPGEAMLFGSHCTNPLDDGRPDWQYVAETITLQKWDKDRAQISAYIDLPAMSELEYEMRGKYIVIMNGSGSEAPEYVAKKDPGKDVYLSLLDALPPGLKIYAVGSKADEARNPWLREIADETFFGDIRQALKLIGAMGCQFVVSNDCGLAHAAGVFNKEMIVIWKDTPRIRCQNMGANTQYLYPEQWQQKLHIV